MAIGARITSTNLSGKTATVTFTPYTGNTSGSTQNLGTKTIPFNNITSHPYGNYSLYFAEYDYTYTLNIPEPITSAQLFVYVDRMGGSTNYGAATLNFNDFTAEVIDLGVDADLYNNRNVYALNESGFMYEFRELSNSTSRLVIFTDVTNNEIGRYSGITEDYSADELDGRVLIYEDEDNGVLTYSNGRVVNTFTWNPETHYIDIESSYNTVASSNLFIVKKIEIGGTYNGSGESFIINANNGEVTPFKTWIDGNSINHFVHPNADFIIVETRDDINDLIIQFEVCDLDGNVLEDVSFSGDTINNSYGDFVGSNKFNIVYFNYNNSNQDYKILNYNGDTSTLIQTQHERGELYPNVDVSADDNFWSDDTVNGGVVIAFHNSTSYSNAGGMVTYCDFIYMLNGQNNFSSYTYAENETKNIVTYGQMGGNFRTYCDTGNGNLSVFTILPGSVHIEDLQIETTTISYLSFDYLNLRSIFSVTVGNGENGYVILIDENGVVSDRLDMPLGQNGVSVRSLTNVAYGRIDNSIIGPIGFYVYSGSTGFTPIDYYQNYTDSNTFYSETFMYPDVLILYNDESLSYRVLSATGVSNELFFPEYSNRNIEVGKDKYMIVYADPTDNNYIKINLYDLSGVLLNSGTTQFNSGWNNTFAVKDRFVLTFEGEGTVIYLVSEDIITYIVTSNYDTTYSTNDYFYEND